MVHYSSSAGLGGDPEDGGGVGGGAAEDGGVRGEGRQAQPQDLLVEERPETLLLPDTGQAQGTENWVEKCLNLKLANIWNRLFRFLQESDMKENIFRRISSFVGLREMKEKS